MPEPPRHPARRPVAPFALALALGCALAAGPAAGRGGAPAVALSDCRLAPPAGATSVPARCGRLEVPENPAEPAGRRISLALAVVPALDRRRTREPLFVVAGGPGQAASDFYAAYAPAFAPVLRDHDVVILDQRGTGGSNRLRCDFPADFDVATPSPARIRELSAACRRGLPGRPEFYTTSVAVRDLDAVRAALGYEAISLYGVSYGTRVVVHYVRRFGAHVRAVVLDGALSPEASPVADTPLDAERALGLAFGRCHADAACDRAFPDLGERFARLRRELAAEPRRVRLPDPSSGAPREISFDGAALAGAVRLLNYQASTTALLPFLIDRAARHDPVPLAAQLLLLGAHLDTQVAYGMNAAVSCSEDVPSISRADRSALAATYLGTTQLDGLAALCDGWPRGLVDADLYAPLAAAGPALVLSGEADPITPPRDGARAARGFRDALHVIVPGQGHGQLAVGCTPRVIAAFLDAGTTRGLDVHCLAVAAAPPFVVDLSGPAP